MSIAGSELTLLTWDPLASHTDLNSLLLPYSTRCVLGNFLRMRCGIWFLTMHGSASSKIKCTSLAHDLMSSNMFSKLLSHLKLRRLIVIFLAIFRTSSSTFAILVLHCVVVTGFITRKSEFRIVILFYYFSIRLMPETKLTITYVPRSSCSLEQNYRDIFLFLRNGGVILDCLVFGFYHWKYFRKNLRCLINRACICVNFLLTVSARCYQWITHF